MKKLISIILLLSLAAAAFTGCHRLPGPDISDITTPAPDATAVPAAVDPAMIDGVIGDWYGVFTVVTVGGIYADNFGIRNDCALRVALDESGKGSCYLVVNGLEGGNVLANCAASLDETKLMLIGSVGGKPVEWAFERQGTVMKLTEKYGDEADFMDFEIVVSRPDMLALSGLRPDATDYIAKNGYADIVDRLGGSGAELPAVTPLEGYADHVFFTRGGPVDDPEPTEAPNLLVCCGGHVMLSLPDSYVVLQNDNSGFIAACPEENVWSIEFSYTEAEADALSVLLANNPNPKMITHYVIDGYDCYGAFLDGENQSSTVFRLCGSNGEGGLLMISMDMGMDAHSAYYYVNVRNGSFAQLVLGAMMDR